MSDGWAFMELMERMIEQHERMVARKIGPIDPTPEAVSEALGGVYELVDEYWIQGDHRVARFRGINLREVLIVDVGPGTGAGVFGDDSATLFEKE
jgi:hypothetical protein